MNDTVEDGGSWVVIVGGIVPIGLYGMSVTILGGCVVVIPAGGMVVPIGL